MMRKLLLLTAGGIGYVLGARAGRERYEQIAGMASKVKNDPRVQDAAQQAAETAKAQAPVVKDKVTSVAGSAADKVKPSGSSDSSGSSGSGSASGPGSASDLESQLNPESTALQDNPYPQGNLP